MTRTQTALALGAAAVALSAGAATGASAKADNHAAQPGMEKGYGGSLAGTSDWAAGAPSCAGQATKDFAKTSFVSLPAGVCAKLASGTLTAMAK